MKAKSLQFILGLVVSLGLLAWLVAALDWNLVLQELVLCNYWALIPGSVLLVIHFLIRAERWRYLLGGRPEIPSRELVDAIMVGNFANFILPLRAGEFIRPYALQARTGVPFATGFASVVTERFFDLSAVLLTFSLVVSGLPSLPLWASAGALSLSILAGAILIFIGLAVFIPERLQSIATFFLKILPAKICDPLSRFVTEFIAGAAALRNPSNLFRVVLLTGLIWGSCYALYYSYLLLGDFPLEFKVATTVSVIIALAVAAPSAPGFVGVYQTACLAGFALFGVPAEKAVSFAIITHVHQYVFYVAYGAFVLWRYNMKLSDLAGKRVATNH